MNKDVAHIIGRYSLPTLWKVELSSLSDETLYFYGEDIEKIYQWLSDNRKDVIYAVVYNLFRWNKCYDRITQRVVQLEPEHDLKNINKDYYQNTLQWIQGLSNYPNSGLNIQKIENIVNTY